MKRGPPGQPACVPSSKRHTTTDTSSSSLSSSTSPSSTSLGYSTSSLSSFAGNSFSATSAESLLRLSKPRIKHFNCGALTARQ